MKKSKLGHLIPGVLLSLSSMAVYAGITLDTRTIPVPAGVSEQMANIIEQRDAGSPLSVPVPQNTEQWLTLQKQYDASGIDIAQQALKNWEVTYEAKEFAGVNTFFVTPKQVAPEYKDKWLVHIHGGAFVFGGGESALREAIWVSNGLGANVISIDYRQPPLHPFPAAIDDAVAVWQELIKTQPAEQTAMFGTSAGGNLTLATTLALQKAGIATPGALYVGTPAVDLKHTSDTWHTLKGLDPLGQREGIIDGTFSLYAGGEALDHPLVSPIYAEIDTFPPTLFFSGTRDLLLSDTVRMHRHLRAADVTTELHIYDGQSHGDYITSLVTDLPESEDALKELAHFFNKHIN